MSRSVTVAALLLAFGGTALAQSADAPPTQPGNFRATLYDKAGGELFWQRSTDDRGAVRGYEITRNGQSLGIRDALSFYDASLRPGTPYTFTVVAIDNAGQRSTLATTTLGGGTSTPPANGGPEAPDALRADVYSGRSAELFWQREPATLALRYEIRRDGRVVGTTNGVSYYTNTLAAGTDYTFEVIALGRDDRRSSPSRVTVRTAGDGSTNPPVAGGPDTPDELRVAVYSRRSAELFWQREPAALALRYEIRRDDRVVGTTTGVSYYTNALAGGTDYAFEVIAIGRDDRRSSPATIAVRTDGDSGPAPSVLAMPANLRADVYSRTNAELFWDRAAMRGLRYEVRRDGEVIGTTDGTSFYDDALAGGTSYTYEVVTIDGTRRSSGSRLSLTTDGEEAPPGVEPVAPGAPRLVSVDPETGASTRDGTFPPGRSGRRNSVTEDGRFVFYDIENSLFRYRLEDGNVDRVADGDRRSRQFLGGVSDDGDTVLLDNGDKRVARSSDGFVQRTFTAGLPPATRITDETLSGDGSTIAFVTNALDSRAFVHDIGSGTLTEVTRETAPSNDPTVNDVEWRISSVAAISADGQTVVFGGRANGSALFVHDRANGSTRVVPFFRGLPECGSCPPENSGPAPLLSADGRTLVYSSVPEERRAIRDPESDLYRLDLPDGAAERIPDSTGADGLSGDDALDALVWRKGSIQTLVPLNGDERVTLTRRGYGRCPVRVCMFGDGDSDELTPELSADGSTAVFVERTADGESGPTTPINVLRAYDVTSDRFDTALDSDDARSVDPVSVLDDFAVSADGSVIVLESSIRPSSDEEPRSVVFAIER